MLGADIAAGSTCGKRNNKRKASEQARKKKFDSGVNNQNNSIAVTNRSFDRQHHDLFGDDWTTSCWCWAPPKTNIGISGVEAAVAAGSICRRSKKRKTSEVARESRCIIQNKDKLKSMNNNDTTGPDMDKDGDLDDTEYSHCDDDDDDDYDENDDEDNDDDNNDGSELDHGSFAENVVVTSKAKTTNNKRQFSRDSIFVKRWDDMNFNHAQWMEMYDRLVEYKKQHKSTCVPRRYEDDPSLGYWVSKQRTNNNTNCSRLTPDRKHQLNSIRFIWDALDACWTKSYDRLLAYKNQYNSTCIPRSYKADPQLATWVKTQRVNRNKLTAERKHQLNSIDFCWDPLDAQWTEKYDRLVKYKQQNETTCVPQLYPVDPQLGQWVSQQRKCYRTKNPRLTVDRISQLDSIGFVWNGHDAQWTEKYGRLIEYKKHNKFTCIPYRNDDDPSLGHWVGKQRIYYNSKNPRLTEVRITQLDSIGFVWH